MPGFDIGGIGRGVQKGFQYDLQFSRELVWAAKHGNAAAMADLVKVAEKNIMEIAGGAADVSQSHAVSLLFASDPFQESRQMMHDYEAKYGKH